MRALHRVKDWCLSIHHTLHPVYQGPIKPWVPPNNLAPCPQNFDTFSQWITTIAIPFMEDYTKGQNGCFFLSRPRTVRATHTPPTTLPLLTSYSYDHDIPFHAPPWHTNHARVALHAQSMAFLPGFWHLMDTVTTHVTRQDVWCALAFECVGGTATVTMSTRRHDRVIAPEDGFTTPHDIATFFKNVPRYFAKPQPW